MGFLQRFFTSIVVGNRRRRKLSNKSHHSGALSKTRKKMQGLGKTEGNELTHEEEHGRSKLYYSISEAIVVFSVPRTRLYELMSSGELPWSQLGGTRRLAHDDMVELMARHQKRGKKRSKAEETGHHTEEE